MDSRPPPPPPVDEEPPPPPPRIVSSTKPKIVRERKPYVRPRYHQRRPSTKDSGRAFIIMKTIVISFLLLILALMLVPQLRDSPLQWLNPLSYRPFPEMAEFTIERRMSISGVQRFGFDIPVPGNISGTQRVLSMGTSPSPTIVENRYGRPWMEWEATPGQTISVITRYRTWTVWWNVNSQNSLTVDEARMWDPIFNVLSEQYNHDEWRIEVTHPDIISLARQLENPRATIYENIQSIFRYLDVNFEYSTRNGGEVKLSSQTLHDRAGDCDDMSFLFTALARAMGIPAWPELGAMHTSLTGEWIGHGWVEVYMPTTQGGQNVTIDMVNDEFLVRGANRFSDFKSDGVGDHLEDYYYSYSFLPQKFEVPEISDYFVDRGYKTDGTVTVKLGYDGRPVPLFEFLFVFVSVLIATFIIVRLAKRRNRRLAGARR